MTAITCMVGLLISTQTGPNHLNIELKGYEVYEVGSNRSLVDFTAAIRAHRLRIIGPTVIIIETNMCRYEAKDVAQWNAINSDLTAEEQHQFNEYSKLRVGEAWQSHASKFLNNNK